MTSSSPATSPVPRRTSSRLARSAAGTAKQLAPAEAGLAKTVKRRKLNDQPKVQVEVAVKAEVKVDTSAAATTSVVGRAAAKAVAVKRTTTTRKKTIKREDSAADNGESSCCGSHRDGDEGQVASDQKPAAQKSSTNTAAEIPKAKKTASKKKGSAPLTQMDTAAMWARADACRKYVGAHVSAAGGIWPALEHSTDIGGTALALFVRNQRKWTSPATPAEDIVQFAASAALSGHDPRRHILPHGSYLINLANKDPEKSVQAWEGFVDELRRTEALGIALYNFHPGSTLKEPRDEAIARIVDAINRAHKATVFVTIVLEGMAGQGNVIGSTFEDLRDIIAAVDDKTRVGVCLDTCHMFAAGYDIRTASSYASTMDEFDTVVGFKFLRALHLNDSKAAFASRKDRHENLGRGEIGWEAFRLIMNDKRMDGLPMVLETPVGDAPDNGHSVYRKEIEQLYELVGKKEGYVPSG